VSGRLVVCPTPIGNLEDVTLRVLAALRDADIVACEDTRRTRVLLDRYGVAGRLVSYHEHNERQRAEELVARMREGAVVALVSDAGTPLISDPGFKLMREACAAGHSVVALPGPSSVLAALSVGFTSMAQSSTVLSPAEQQQGAQTLEHDAEVVSNTQLEKQLAGQPAKTQDEIIKINTQARHLALQIALLIPILAGLTGLGISFRMMRLPDPQQSGTGDQAVLG